MPWRNSSGGNVERRPEFEVGTGIAVLRRHNTDDFKGLAVELNLTAQNSGIGAETVRPKGITQQGNMRIGELFLLCEGPAQ